MVHQIPIRLCWRAWAHGFRLPGFGTWLPHLLAFWLSLSVSQFNHLQNRDISCLLGCPGVVKRESIDWDPHAVGTQYMWATVTLCHGHGYCVLVGERDFQQEPSNKYIIKFWKGLEKNRELGESVSGKSYLERGVREDLCEDMHSSQNFGWVGDRKERGEKSEERKIASPREKFYWV